MCKRLQIFRHLAKNGMQYAARRRPRRYALAYPLGPDPDLAGDSGARRQSVLGTWQGLYVFEHRDVPHRAKCCCINIGD